MFIILSASIIGIFIFSAVLWIVLSRSPRRHGRRQARRFREPTVSANREATDDLLEEEANNSQRTVVIDDSILDEPVPMGDIPLETRRDEQRSVENPSPMTQIFTSDMIVLYVMASEESVYSGYGLLQSLLGNGLRYGEMKIFHRHQNLSGQGPILFSLASAHRPGIFELSEMGYYSCPGLVLFMSKQKSNGPSLISIFDMMWSTAQQLCEDLGGEVWDDQRQVMDAEKVKDIRAHLLQLKIHEFQHT